MDFGLKKLIYVLVYLMRLFHQLLMIFFIFFIFWVSCCTSHNYVDEDLWNKLHKNSDWRFIIAKLNFSDRYIFTGILHLYRECPGPPWLLCGLTNQLTTLVFVCLFVWMDGWMDTHLVYRPTGFWYRIKINLNGVPYVHIQRGTFCLHNYLQGHVCTYMSTRQGWKCSKNNNKTTMITTKLCDGNKDGFRNDKIMWEPKQQQQNKDNNN